MSYTICMRIHENIQHSRDIYGEIFILWHSVYLNLSIHWNIEFRYSIELLLMCHCYITRSFAQSFTFFIFPEKNAFFNVLYSYSSRSVHLWTLMSCGEWHWCCHMVSDTGVMWWVTLVVSYGEWHWCHVMSDTCDVIWWVTLTLCSELCSGVIWWVTLEVLYGEWYWCHVMSDTGSVIWWVTMVSYGEWHWCHVVSATGVMWWVKLVSCVEWHWCHAIILFDIVLCFSCPTCPSPPCSWPPSTTTFRWLDCWSATVPTRPPPTESNPPPSAASNTTTNIPISNLNPSWAPSKTTTFWWSSWYWPLPRACRTPYFEPCRTSSFGRTTLARRDSVRRRSSSTLSSSSRFKVSRVRWRRNVGARSENASEIIRRWKCNICRCRNALKVIYFWKGVKF